MTTKEKIVAFLGTTAEATSYDVYEHLQTVSNDAVSRNLKELADAGTLVRERKSTNGGPVAYHYKLANPTATTVATNATKVNEATEQPAGPVKVYLVRNDNHPNWGRHLGTYMQVLAPYIKFGQGARAYSKIDSTVTSIFITDSPISEISASLIAALPQLEFTLATTLDEAKAAITEYSAGNVYDVDRMDRWAQQFFAQFEPVSERHALEALASGDRYNITNKVYIALVEFARTYLATHPEPATDSTEEQQ